MYSFKKGHGKHPICKSTKNGADLRGFLIDDLIGHWCFHSSFLLVEAIKHAVALVRSIFLLVVLMQRERHKPTAL